AGKAPRANIRPRTSRAPPSFNLVIVCLPGVVVPSACRGPCQPQMSSVETDGLEPVARADPAIEHPVGAAGQASAGDDQPAVHAGAVAVEVEAEHRGLRAGSPADDDARVRPVREERADANRGRPVAERYVVR